MSQLPQNYDTSNIDWSKVLEPSQATRDDSSIRRALAEDLWNMAESVRLGKKPEEYYTELNLSRATGLPFSLVEEDKDTAFTLAYKKALKGSPDELRRLIDNSPSMLEFVQTVPAAEGAAMVTDKPLWSMEKVQRGFFDETAHSLEVGAYSQERMRLLYKDFGGLVDEADQKRILFLEDRLSLEEKRREDEGAFDWIHRSSVELLPQLGDMAVNMAERGGQGLVLGAGTGAAIGAAGGAAAGSLFPGAGTIAGGGAGALGGAVTGGLTGLKGGVSYGALEHSYKLAVAEIWGSIRNMEDAYGNKIDPDTARGIAAIGALPIAGLDLLSVGKAAEVVPGLDRFLNQSAVEAAAKFLRENPGVMGALGESSRKIFAALGTEVVTEALQEGVVVAAEEIAKNTGHMDIASISGQETVQRMLEAGKEAFAAVLPLSIGGGAARTYANRKRQQAQKNADTLRQMHVLASESETLGQVPELAQEYFKQLGENGGAKDLYIRPEAVQRVFFQTEEGIAAAADMGITPEALAESLALDVDIIVPADKAAVHILNNKQVFDEISPDLRLDPATMTPREAQTYSGGKEGEASVQDRENFDFLDSVFAGLNEEIALNERRARMAAPFVEQLTSAGYSERQALHMMTLFVANAEQMAPMFNQTPEAYLGERFAGFHLTTQEAAGMTEADLEHSAMRKLAAAPLKERDPLLAAVWGRLDPADLKNYDSQGARELTRQYGRGLFKGKDKGGQALDLLADELVRDGLLPEGSGANELLERLAAPRRLFQPLNPGVDLDAQVPVVRVDPRFEEKEAWKLAKGGMAKELKKLSGVYRNSATGWDIEVTRKGIAHAAGTVAKRNINQQAHMEAVANLPQLIENALPVESHADRKGQGLNKVHRMYAGMQMDGSLYTVKLTIKGMQGKRQAEIEGIYRLYDSGITKKTPGGAAPAAMPGGWGTDSTSGVFNIITLRDLLEGVKDHEGNAFFQGMQNARGSIDFNNPQAVIYLFKGKRNLSTVIHEGGHFFLENMREAAQLADAPEWVRQSWQTLQQEYGFSGYEITRDAHERFARAFEAYARSGKAPSPALQSAFRQFSNWLTRLYRSVRSLVGEKEISPEIKNVFDRLLATEQEIEEARRQGAPAVSLEAMEANGLPVSPELKGRYALAVAEAHAKAAAAIEARRMVEQRRMEKRFRSEAEAEIERNPFYRAESDVRDRGGIRWDSVLAYIDEDLAEELRRKWAAPFTKGLFKTDGALDFIDVAADFDAESPQNLAGLLLSTPTRKEAVDGAVQASLAEWDKSFDGSMEYSNAMDAALALELEALTGEKQLSGAQFRAELDRRTGVKKLAAVDSEYKALKESLRKQESVLREVMRDAGREKKDAVQAERSAWQKKVTELKTQERIKRAALAASYRARMERDKLTRHIRNTAASKAIHDAFRQQILSLVAHWRNLGSSRMKPRDAANTPTLLDFVQQFDSLFEEEQSLFPDWLYAESQRAGAKSTGDLTLDQLRDVSRAIAILAHKGRRYNEFLSFGRQVLISEAAGQCIEAMSKAAGTRHITAQERAQFGGKVRGLFRGLASGLTSMRYVLDALDGYVNKGGKGTSTGPNHKYISAPLQASLSKERTLLREYETKVAKALEPLYRRNMDKAFALDVPLPDDVRRDWGGLFTHEKVIAAALNMGNAGNIKALKRGYGWSDTDLAAIGSRLTVAEWRAVQGIWDTINELYPELNAVHIGMHGVPLAKVAVEPLTVRAADGEITLEGGYYPLLFDHQFSRKAEEMQSADDQINRREALIRSPNPKSGFTKERTGGTLPPKLDLSVVSRHVIDTIHYITHAQALRDVSRLTGTPEYRQAFIDAAGIEAYNELLPWLRHIARPEGELAGKWGRIAERLAKRGTLFVLGLNMKSAFLQLASVGNSIQEVGAASFMKGVFQMTTRTHTAYREVKNRSAYMESRSRQLDASLKEHLDRFSPERASGVVFMGKWFTLEQVQNAQFALIQTLDAAVAYPTWIGAYDKAVASGLAENEAVSKADEAVIRAQGSGGAMDVPAVLRERGFIKLSTTFMSYALNDFNRKQYFTGGLREYMRGGNSNIDFKTFAQHFVLEWVLPVVATTYMISLGRDGELPDWKDFTWEALGFLTMGIPVIRDASRLAEGTFSGKGYGVRMGGSAGFAGVESFINALKHGSKAVLDDDPKAKQKFGRELVNAMGFYYGIGTPQLWRTWDGAEAYFVDGKGGILAPVLGKPQKK